MNCCFYIILLNTFKVVKANTNTKLFLLIPGSSCDLIISDRKLKCGFFFLFFFRIHFSLTFLYEIIISLPPFTKIINL